jgi:cell shape-determining protein MreC
MKKKIQQLHSRKAILGDFVRSINQDLKEALQEINIINSNIKSLNKENQTDMFGEEEL